MYTPRVFFRDSKSTILVGGLVVSALLTVLVAFYAGGGMHGLYEDDYSSKIGAFDLSTGQWQLRLIPQTDFRYVRYVLTPNLANLLPDHEWLARAIILILHGTDVLLLGLLILRLTRSRVSAILGSALFLVPLYANQGLLQFTSAFDNPPALLFVLLGFHLLLSARSFRESPTLIVGGVASWLMAPMFYESALFTYLLLPFFGMLCWPREVRPRLRVWLVPLIIVYLILLPYAYFVLRGAWRVGGHGTIDPVLILTTRVPEVLSSLSSTLASQEAFGLYAEALQLGVRAWTSSYGGTLVLVSAAVALVMSAFLIPISNSAITSPRRFLLIILAGVLWICLWLIPILLVNGQMIESRILYAGMVGFVLCAVGLLGLATGFAGRWRILRMRVAMLLVAVVMMLTSLTVAGFVRAYQLRWILDQKQLAALHQVVPQLPDSQRIWLLPIQLDERTVRRYFERDVALDYYLVGVFETTWSGEAAVSLDYQKGNVDVGASNRREKPTVSGVTYEQGKATTLSIPDTFAGGAEVPIDRLIAFTYKKNHVVLLSPITLIRSDSSRIVVNLPLVDRLAADTAEKQSIELELSQP